MSVQPGPTDKRYAANGVSTIYTVPFLVIEAGDLNVYLNDVLMTSGYTHTGIGDPTSTLTFTTPPLGDLYLLLDVPFQRLTDYQENGDLLANTLNRDFDRIWQALKQLFGWANRSLRLGSFDIDGQGSYRAKGNGIVNLASAGENANAATNLQDVRDYVADVLETGQGPINNAANIFYQGADGLPHVVQDLSGPDGYKLIGGAAKNSDDYTLIRPSFRRISTSFSDIALSLSGVITGDSLSFNAFGYSGWPAAGGAYATDNPFGLSSWAHLLRDLCLTSSPAFVPIQDVTISTDSTITYLDSNYFNYGINQRVINFYFGSTSKKLVLQNQYTGARCIIVSYAPASESCTFEVDGVEYNNVSPTGHYISRGYMLIPHAGEYATITNVRYDNGGQGGNLWVYGVGDGGRNVPKLTGKGAWTSGQILAEYSTLVAPYSPDYIFYIIGANDIGLGVSVEDFCANLVSFINLARTAKPNCEIVLLSTPPTSSYSRDLARQYIKGMRKVAEDKSCSLIDLHTNLEQIDPSYYRHDNIHFNRQGDTIVFNIIKGLLFPDIPLDYKTFSPVREALLGIGGYFYRKPRAKIRLSVLINCGATPTVVQYLGNPEIYSSLALTYSGSGVSSVLNITPPFGYVVDSIESITLGVATAARIAIQSLQAGNVVVAGAVTSAANVDIINSGLYALINYRQT